MPPRSARRRRPIAARKIIWYLDVGGLMKPSPRFLLDQFIDLLRKETRVERRKWLAASADTIRAARTSHAAR